MTTMLPTTQVKYPKAQGYGARLDQLFVRLAPDRENLMRYYTKDSLAERQDDRGSFYENVLDLGYAWARTDWSGGQGLDWDPPDRTVLQGEANLDGIRFWDSDNLNIDRDVVDASDLAESRGIRLSPRFTNPAFSFTTPKDMTASKDNIFVIDGSDVEWFSTWETGTPDDTDTLASAPDAIAAAPNGVCMAVTANGHIFVRPEAGTAFIDLYTPAGNRNAIGVWYTKGRFVVGFEDTDDGIFELSEVTSTDAWATNLTEAIIDTADAAFWSVVDSGPALVAACGDGTVRTYTPFLDSNDPAAVGQLIARGRTPVPSGEAPYLLGDVGGALIILTVAVHNTTETVSAYSSEVLDNRFDYSVGQLQLLRRWEQITQRFDVTQAMASTRNSLFFVIYEASGAENVWRFDAITLGISRHQRTGSTDDGEPTDPTTTGLIRYEGRIGGIDTQNDNTFVAHETEFNDGGFIITPNITFGLNTDLNWIASVVEVRGLTGGAQVELYRSLDPTAISDPDHGSWVLVRRLTNDTQSGVEVPMVGVTGRSLTFQMKLIQGTDMTANPVVSRLAIRGLPRHRDWIVELPVNVSDLIEVPGRQPVRVSGWGDRIHKAMLSLQGTHLELEVFDPPLLFRGIVSNIHEPTTWISPRGSSGRRCTVEFRGNRIETEVPSVPTMDWLTGMGLAGQAVTGQPQSGVLS